MNILKNVETSEKKNVLVIDDDESIRFLFHRAIENMGARSFVAASYEEAVQLLKRFRFDGILLDQNLGDVKGTDILSDLLRISPHSKIVFLTSSESIPLVKEGILLGASDFLFKKDQVHDNLLKFFELLESKNVEDAELSGVFPDIVAESAAMKSILSSIHRLRLSSATILLTGESGVGKELIAQAIHKSSQRRDEPFLAVNCAAISENLLESELFGSKKGAFTDSKMDRKGYFETCSRGTLLLDEIGEMNQTLQAKLLRVLQEKEVTPLGDCRPIKVNTRIIAATNRELKDEISNHRFREDLFYRLAVITLKIPPLRDRPEDIAPLVTQFLKKLNSQHNKNVVVPRSEVTARLKAYAWPGNIRELYNSVERAVLLSRDQEMSIEDMLPHRELVGEMKDQDFFEPSLPLDYTEAKDYFEKIYVNKLLQSTNNNVSEAAKISGQYRTNIYRIMKKHNIKAHPERH